MKRPTQLDVARKAGVSRSTVSFVLNDQDGGRIPISAETRQRVLDAISELGYEPDSRAQSLRSGNTKTIGVLVHIYENPFYWQVLLGISAEAEAAGYSLLLSHSTLTPEQEMKSIRELSEQRVDGLILLIGFKEFSEHVMDQIRKSNRPIVVNNETPYGFDYVDQGYGDGARALMAHLMELGHVRIGFLFGVTVESQGIDRLTAYQKVLEGAGLQYDESLVVRCGERLEDGYQAAYEMLCRPDRPTAIITINDLMGMAALRATADLGLRVPHDVSIAGFDDVPFSNYIIPRLTTVAGSPEQNGRDAVRLLLNRLANPERPREISTRAWQLHIRESTGPVPDCVQPIGKDRR